MLKNSVAFLLALGFGFVSVHFLFWDSGFSNNADIITVQDSTFLESPTIDKTPGSPPVTENRFHVAGIDDDREITQLYSKFLRAVASDDKQTVSSLLLYPLNVTFPNDRPDRNYTIIKSKKAFLKIYDRLFDDRLKSFISRIDVENQTDIWARFDGIAVGRGVIWIGVYCFDRKCNDNRHYSKIRTIHGDSNLMDLE